jgi:small subunit ribosomal protein S9
MAKGIKYDVHAIGRRKAAIARVYVVKGSGKIFINRREMKEYFPLGTQQYVVLQPMNEVKVADKYDILVNVNGGGVQGQAGAVRLGISRALIKLDPARRPELKKAGFLTRDSRVVERKKYGLSGARKSYQFSKR